MPLGWISLSSAGGWGQCGPKESPGFLERAALARPLAPVYRKPTNIAYLFRAKPGAAGAADAVPTAGGPALQPQPHGRAALPQHGGESRVPPPSKGNTDQLGGGGLKTPHALFNVAVCVHHPYR